MGDGARSGELKAPVTGPFKPTPHPSDAPRIGCDDACSFVSITFDSAGIGSLKRDYAGLLAYAGACVIVTQT